MANARVRKVVPRKVCSDDVDPYDELEVHEGDPNVVLVHSSGCDCPVTSDGPSIEDHLISESRAETPRNVSVDKLMGKSGLYGRRS